MTLPEGVQLIEAMTLIIISFGTSFMTAAFGIGGGTLMLAVLTVLLPLQAIIPVHGAVQLGSNSGRAILFSRSIEYRLLLQFMAGSAVGAILGSFFISWLNPIWIELILGIFILYSIAGGYQPTYGKHSLVMGLGGFLTTALTFVVGATGPFVLALLKPFKLSPQFIVGTMAGCLVVQHGLKIIVFGFSGFDFESYLSLIIAMIITGTMGTYFGKKMLIKIDNKKFQKALNIILCALGLKLFLSGFWSLFTLN